MKTITRRDLLKSVPIWGLVPAWSKDLFNVVEVDGKRGLFVLKPNVVGGSLRFESTPLALNVSSSFIPIVLDEKGNSVKVSFTSNSSDVVNVSPDNRIVGLKEGTATITAHRRNQTISAFVRVTKVANSAAGKSPTEIHIAGNQIFISSSFWHDVQKRLVSDPHLTVFLGQKGVAGNSTIGTAGPEVLLNAQQGIDLNLGNSRNFLAVADTANHLAKIIRADGTLVESVGNESPGTMTMDRPIPFEDAVFRGPQAVVFIENGDVIVADSENFCLWRLNLQQRLVFHLAGIPGQSGLKDGTAKQALFGRLSKLEWNPITKNLLAVDGQVIRLISLNGNVRTIRSQAKNPNTNQDEVSLLKFTNLTDIAMGPMGTGLYVLAGKTLSFISFDPDGNVTGFQDAVQPGTLKGPRAVSTYGSMTLVVDPENGEQESLRTITTGAPYLDASEFFGSMDGGEPLRLAGGGFGPETWVTLGDKIVPAQVVSSKEIVIAALPAQAAPGSILLSVITRGGIAQANFHIQARGIDGLPIGTIGTFSKSSTNSDLLKAVSEVNLVSPRELGVNQHGLPVILDQFQHTVAEVNEFGRLKIIAGVGFPTSSGVGNPWTATGLIEPTAYAPDGSGNFYVGDRDRLLLFNAATGRSEELIGANSLVQVSKVTALVVFEDRLLILDSGSDRVLTMNRSSREVTELISKKDGDFLFQLGQVPCGDLAIGPDNDLYIADTGHNLIKRYDFVTKTIIIIDNLQLIGPCGIAFDSLQRLVIADTLQGRIVRVEQDGTVKSILGNGTQEFKDHSLADQTGLYPVKVRYNAMGDLYIADPKNKRILVFDETAGLVHSVVGGGSTPRISLPVGLAENDQFVVLCDLNSPGLLLFDKLAGTLNRKLFPEQFNLLGPTCAAFDTKGNLFVTFLFRHVILKIDPLGQSSIFAGQIGKQGAGGNDVIATDTMLLRPSGIAIDKDDNVIFVEAHRIRKIDGRTNVITTVAGSGTAGFSGDGGPASQALFSFGPDFISSVVISSNGTIFVSDTANNRVRCISKEGTVFTVAGNGTFAAADGKLGTESGLNKPRGLALLGDILLVSESNGHSIRQIDLRSGVITTLVNEDRVAGATGDGGDAKKARVEFPNGLLISGGNCLIADTYGASIRIVKLQ